MPIEDVDNFLIANGRSLNQIGLREFGLTRIDALTAISLIKKSSTPIVGGDVYVQVDSKIRPAYSNWHCDPKPGEERDIYFARSWTAADAYIRNFPDSTDGELLFVLVTGKAIPGGWNF